MTWLLAWLAIGTAFAVHSLATGVLSLRQHTATYLRSGKPPFTKTTREVPDFLVGLVFHLLAWPVFIGHAAYRPVRDWRAQRAWRGNPPPWLSDNGKQTPGP